MKVNINKLPEGFKIENGKVVETKSHGGMHTGDQHNYHLVTNTDTHFYKGPSETDPFRTVNTSLKPVPREEANIEAEKNETVLTDMNDDGVFELYNIAGKRHSRGGTPLDLPPQSFIFSDTREMKLSKDEQNELGLEYKKKMTPAKISRKYQLNKFINVLDDPQSDHISVDTAEYMLDKHKRKLSHLAFVQEAKKEFVEGVPLAAYGYLKEQGIDPEEYAAKIEQLNKKEIQLEAKLETPPSIQETASNLAQFISQIDQQRQQADAGIDPQQPPMQAPPQGQMAPPMPQGAMPPDQLSQGMPMPQQPPMIPQGQMPQQPSMPELAGGGEYGGVSEKNKKQLEQFGYSWDEGENRWTHPDLGNDQVDYVTYQMNQGRTVNLANPVGIPGIGDEKGQQSRYQNPEGDGYIYKGAEGDTLDIEGFLTRQGPLLKGIKLESGDPMFTEDNPFDPYNKDHVKAFQTEHRRVADNLYKTDPKLKEMYPDINDYYKASGTFHGEGGYTGIDSKFGEYTSHARSLTDPPKKDVDVEIVQNTDDCPDAEKKAAECKEQGLAFVAENCGCGPTPPDFKTEKETESPEFWLQDQIKMTDLYQKKLNMKKYMPWAATVTPVGVDATYVDPTQAISSIQSSARDAGDSTVYAGKAANMAAKMKAQGMAMDQIANVFARTQEANMQENQQVRKMNTMLKSEAANKNAMIKTKLYDDVQRVHADYDNTKAKLNTQIANQLANSYTNMSNTENLNTLYPQFDIDQGSGGFINFENPQDLFPKPPTSDESRTDRFVNTMQDLEKRGIDVSKLNDSTLTYLAELTDEDKKQDEKNKNPYAEASPFVQAIAQGGYGKYGTEKKNRIKLQGAKLRQWFSPLQKRWAD